MEEKKDLDLIDVTTDHVTVRDVIYSYICETKGRCCELREGAAEGLGC